MRDWMRALRGAKGLTMKEAGAILGISESYYCTIENGVRKKELNVSLVSRLSELFDVSVAEIVAMETQNE